MLVTQLSECTLHRSKLGIECIHAVDCRHIHVRKRSKPTAERLTCIVISMHEQRRDEERRGPTTRGERHHGDVRCTAITSVCVSKRSVSKPVSDPCMSIRVTRTTSVRTSYGAFERARARLPWPRHVDKKHNGPSVSMWKMCESQS